MGYIKPISGFYILSVWLELLIEDIKLLANYYQIES